MCLIELKPSANMLAHELKMWLWKVGMLPCSIWRSFLLINRVAEFSFLLRIAPTNSPSRNGLYRKYWLCLRKTRMERQGCVIKMRKIDAHSQIWQRWISETKIINHTSCGLLFVWICDDNCKFLQLFSATKGRNQNICIQYSNLCTKYSFMSLSFSKGSPGRPISTRTVILQENLGALGRTCGVW